MPSASVSGVLETQNSNFEIDLTFQQSNDFCRIMAEMTRAITLFFHFVSYYFYGS